MTNEDKLQGLVQYEQLLWYKMATLFPNAGRPDTEIYRSIL